MERRVRRMISKLTRRTPFIPRFLSFPIRRSLEGVSWASLSVQWRPTEDQKQQLRDQEREEIETLWLPRERPERRPPLHPLGNRRFPFERLYSRLGRARTTPWLAEHYAPRSRSGAQSPSPP